jgi:DNA helicase-2/ATP-dependent DNA helicase PcrA
MLEMALIRWKIPYEVRAGLKFFEKAHIKDLISILTLIVNPSDEIQWIRALSIHKGISSSSALKIMNLFSEDSNHLEEFINTDLPKALKGKRVRKEGFIHLKNLQKFYLKHIMNVESMTILPDNKLPKLLDIMKAAINYMEPLIKENYRDNSEDRLDDLNELINFTTSYRSLNAFLIDILTQFDLKGEGFKEGQMINEEKPLILTTIHQAKGLEWKVVYVMGLLEGRFPGVRSFGVPEEIEEERRLFYVASTRAKDYLYLTYPVWVPNFIRNSPYSIGGMSRFLKEIEDENVFDYPEFE